MVVKLAGDLVFDICLPGGIKEHSNTPHKTHVRTFRNESRIPGWNSENGFPWLGQLPTGGTKEKEEASAIKTKNPNQRFGKHILLGFPGVPGSPEGVPGSPRVSSQKVQRVSEVSSRSLEGSCGSLEGPWKVLDGSGRF